MLKLVSLCLVIFGGVYVKSLETTPQEFPFYVTVFATWICGGALITPDFVVTPAYCVSGATEVSVYLGFSRYPYYEANHNEAKTQIINATDIIVHDLFQNLKDNTYLNDVALIKLPVPAVLNARVRPGTFLSKWEPQLYEQGFVNVTGWKLNTDAQMEVETLEMLSQDTCGYFYGPSYLMHEDRCARRASTGNHLDLTGNIVTSKGKIVGLLSKGDTCTNNHPTCSSETTVFRNLIPYLGWISQKVGVHVGGLTGKEQEITCDLTLIKADAIYHTITETKDELKRDLKGVKVTIEDTRDDLDILQKTVDNCPCAGPRMGS